MKTATTVFGIAIVLAAIGLVFYGGYLAITHVWGLYAQIDPAWRLISLSAFVVFVFGCLIVASAIKVADGTRRQNALGGARIELYKSIVNAFDLQFIAGLANSISHESGFLSTLASKRGEIDLVAGQGVIEKLKELETAIADAKEGETIRGLYRQLIMDMRSDLGHPKHESEVKFEFLSKHHSPESKDQLKHSTGT